MGRGGSGVSAPLNRKLTIMCRQPNALAKSAISPEQRHGLSPEPVWTVRRREKSFAFVRNEAAFPRWSGPRTRLYADVQVQYVGCHLKWQSH
jgi:hypothetical protein